MEYGEGPVRAPTSGEPAPKKPGILDREKTRREFLKRSLEVGAALAASRFLPKSAARAAGDEGFMRYAREGFSFGDFNGSELASLKPEERRTAVLRDLFETRPLIRPDIIPQRLAPDGNKDSLLFHDYDFRNLIMVDSGRYREIEKQKTSPVNVGKLLQLLEERYEELYHNPHLTEIDPDVEQFDKLCREMADATNLPADFIKAMWWQENAAHGTYDIHDQKAARIFRHRDGPLAIYQPKFSLKVMAWRTRRGLGRYKTKLWGDVVRVFAFPLNESYQKNGKDSRKIVVTRVPSRLVAADAKLNLLAGLIIYGQAFNKISSFGEVLNSGFQHLLGKLQKASRPETSPLQETVLEGGFASFRETLRKSAAAARPPSEEELRLAYAYAVYHHGIVPSEEKLVNQQFKRQSADLKYYFGDPAKRIIRLLRLKPWESDNFRRQVEMEGETKTFFCFPIENFAAPRLPGHYSAILRRIMDDERLLKRMPEDKLAALGTLAFIDLLEDRGFRIKLRRFIKNVGMEESEEGKFWAQVGNLRQLRKKFPLRHPPNFNYRDFSVSNDALGRLFMENSRLIRAHLFYWQDPARDFAGTLLLLEAGNRGVDVSAPPVISPLMSLEQIFDKWPIEKISDFVLHSKGELAEALLVKQKVEQNFADLRENDPETADLLRRIIRVRNLTGNLKIYHYDLLIDQPFDIIPLLMLASSEKAVDFSVKSLKILMGEGDEAAGAEKTLRGIRRQLLAKGVSGPEWIAKFKKGLAEWANSGQAKNGKDDKRWMRKLRAFLNNSVPLYKELEKYFDKHFRKETRSVWDLRKWLSPVLGDLIFDFCVPEEGSSSVEPLSPLAWSNYLMWRTPAEDFLDHLATALRGSRTPPPTKLDAAK